MLPDLDSPPGPFWNAPLDGAATLGFDEEFDDRLRNIEVPAITQKYLLETALEHIRGDFGVRPLFVINGGGGWSHSYANHTARISAEMGFGLAHLTWPWYLGRDLVISMERVAQRGSWAHDKKLAPSDIPWSVDAPYSLVFHDRDVSLDAGSVERLLTGLGDGIRYMTANEYSAYLHARVERDIERSGPVSLAVSYDDHYCRYFAGHKSTWTLHLSDEMRRGPSKPVPEKRTVELAPGLGRHVVRVTE
jgi:hypothetical protein